VRAHSLTHPNIIQLKAIVLSPLCMVTSFEDRGDLAHFLADDTVRRPLRLLVLVRACVRLLWLSLCACARRI
jgi:serine/threonine protein kinase